VTGTEWQIDRITKVVDGDTLRVIRSRIEHMGDHDFRITDVNDIPIRLVWVDTPERGDHPGWENARQDLAEWIEAHGDRRCTTPRRRLRVRRLGSDARRPDRRRREQRIAMADDRAALAAVRQRPMNNPGHVGCPVDLQDVLRRVHQGLPVYLPTDPKLIDQTPYLDYLEREQERK
jgi:hypothetical protein